MHRLAQLPPPVRLYLHEFVARNRRLAALRALGVGLLIFTLWTLLACAVDRFMQLGVQPRIALLCAGGVIAAACLLAALRRLRAPVDWVETAAAIERHNPVFGQRLLTVTSRILGSPEHRGSDEMLSQLLREVSEQASAQRGRRLLSVRAVLGPWVGVFVAASSAFALWQAPRVRTGALLHRYFVPTANVPPVTTTQLSVSPGDADILQSDSLKIEARAHQLGGATAWIFLSTDASNWSRYTMDDAGDGRVTYQLSSVDRDLHYYIAGGDAISPRYTIRVKRPPAVAQFRIRYTYPGYTGRAPLTVTNADGAIEAPVGTEALLTVVATEPLQSALLSLGAQKLLMRKTARPNICEASFTIRKETSYELDLISTREVHGGGPGRMFIHALADHPPLVRLLQAGQSLRLSPGDLAPLSYLAMDDYGLESLAVRAQLNGAPPTDAPLPLDGDRRRQEQTVNFDLATLKLAMGDVVTLRVIARDSAGQETPSDDLRVLVAPRAIDADAHERIDGLNASAQLSARLLDELEIAGKSLQETQANADQHSASWLAASARANRNLSAAVESATLLRQALLRVAAHSRSTALSTALAGWMDTARQQAFAADDAFRRAGAPSGMDGPARDRLSRAIEQARDLRSRIGVAAQGERAAAVLADRENLAAAEKRPPPSDRAAVERRETTLQRTRKDIAAGAAEVGLNALAPDLDAQLHARVKASEDLLYSCRSVDYVSAARDWSAALHREPRQKTGFDARLLAAAQAEAVRPDADFLRARDLELAARVAGSIESAVLLAPGKIAHYDGKFNGFPAILEAIERDHNVNHVAEMNADSSANRASNPTHPTPSTARSDEQRLARARADKARDLLAKWLREGTAGREALASVSAAARQAELDDLALRASALGARRDYQQAAEADQSLTRRLTASVRTPGRPPDTRLVDADPPGAAQAIEERVRRIAHTGQEVARRMSDAREMDTLGKTQNDLEEELRHARAGADSGMVTRQRAVAEQIARAQQQDSSALASTTSVVGAQRDMNDPNWRGRATAALLLAQEQLAAMPQDLAAAQEAAAVRRRAADRAAMAQHDASSAAGEARGMADRAATQAQADLADAASRLDKALAPVAPKVAMELADRLDPFAPEATAARDIVAGQMAQALKSLADSASGNDSNAVAQAAGDARRAIDAAQKELARAQDIFAQRDPLVAAKWFSRAAADALAVHPTDLRTALKHQASTALALARAWDRSIHQASALRLSMLPSLQNVYGPLAPESPSAVTSAYSPNLTSPRDWGTLHAREGDDVNAGLREPDPPGYEEPLRLYFEAIGKAQEQAK